MARHAVAEMPRGTRSALLGVTGRCRVVLGMSVVHCMWLTGVPARAVLKQPHLLGPSCITVGCMWVVPCVLAICGWVGLAEQC